MGDEGVGRRKGGVSVVAPAAAVVAVTGAIIGSSDYVGVWM